MGAAADCETIGAGFLGQPVNSLTTPAFVLAGLLIAARRPERRLVGVALAATGVGSFLFHGPMPAGNEWAHDVTLGWLVVVIGLSATSRDQLSRFAALIVLGLVFALFPTVADPAAAGLTALAVFPLLRRDRSLSTLGPLLLLALVAILGRSGATGGPLCDPSSLFQPHGIWHLGSAAAVAWWALKAPATVS